MRSATDFLPSYMIEFMNLVTTISPNFGVRDDLALLGAVAAGHELAPTSNLQSLAAYFGRFAPYFERRCLRFLTPCVSRTPRRM